MKPGTLLYKCRLCGKINISTHTPNVVLSLANILSESNQHNELGNSEDKWGFHNCTDGSLGVTDLIGGCEDKL